MALTFTNKAASQMKHRLWKIKKYSLGGFTFDTQQEYERAKKLNCRLFLRLNKNMILIIQRMPKNVLDAVNKKGDVFKSSVGKAFINKLKRVSKNEK